MVNDRFIIGALLVPFVMIFVVLLIPMGVNKTSFLTNTYNQILTYYTDIPQVLEIKKETTLIEKNPFILKRYVPKISKKTIPSKKQDIRRKVSWDVKLVIMGEKRKYAIINNLFVREGDIINGYLVKKIDLEYVILTKGNRREVVYISR
jgi:hypothetical protein